MKVAICFFGITRSLKFTIDSIKNQIFNVFITNNIDYDIFIHTYQLSDYHNIRSNEFISKNDIDNEEYKLIQAHYGNIYIKINNQDKIKTQLNLNQYRTHRDPWRTRYNSVDNFILAQYSKSQIVKMIKKTNNKYDYILFMRPDCKYLDKFKLDFFKHINNNTICIPNFSLFGTYKFNDRFAITNMNTYQIYGNIFKQLLDLSKKQPLHSETIIGKIINENNIKITRIKFNFTRILFSGKIIDKFK